MQFASSYAWVGKAKKDEKEVFSKDALQSAPQKKRKKRAVRRSSLAKRSAPPAPPQKASQSKPSLLGGFLSAFGSSNSKKSSGQAYAAAAPPRDMDEFLDDCSSDDEDDWGSDCEDELQEMQLDQKEIKDKTRAVRKADTNIVSLNLGTLAEGVAMFTGDPVFCTNCKAVFSTCSKITSGGDGAGKGKEEEDEDETSWKCEFCGEVQEIMLEEEEIPKHDTIDYILQPPKFKDNEAEKIVVFCIDVSGSMCITTEVNSDDFKLKKTKKSELEQYIDRNGGGGLADQWMPNEKRGVTYVSRLQCVQAAVDAQLQSLSKEANSKAVIVTFGNDVIVYDYQDKPHVVTGDKLNDWDILSTIYEDLNIDKVQPVKACLDQLQNRIWSLEEGGKTALGPALLVSTGIASTCAGSSVVLCTDGLANVGLGALEISEDEAQAFYDKVAQKALSAGIAVNVVSIKGTNCNLEFVGKVSADTKGVSHVADPLKLSKNFNYILKNAVIATDCTIKMIMHKGLSFRDVDGKQTIASVNVGNVTKESVVSFEYFMKSGEGIDKLFENLTELPFQVQINYTKLDSTKCIRVISKAEKITKDRDVAEQNINVNVVGLHSQQQAAKLAQQGLYTKARMKQKANLRMVKRQLKSKNTSEQKKQFGLWEIEASRLDNAILEEQQCLDDGDMYDSASEDDSFGEEEIKDEEEIQQKAIKNVKRQKTRAARRRKNDKVSNALYQAQNAMFSDFTFAKSPLHEK